MLIARQRLLKSFSFHHDERNAIRERPIFIAPVAHPPQAAIEKFGTDRNDFNSWTGAHSRHKRQKIGVIFRAGAGISQFQQDEFRRDDEPGNFGFSERAFVARLGFVQQSQIEESVGKDGVHGFFGSPLT